MKRLLPILLAGYFVCHVEDAQFKCLPCGEPDMGCLAVYVTAQQMDDFKTRNAPTEKQAVEELTARVQNLERKIKNKGEHP